MRILILFVTGRIAVLKPSGLVVNVGEYPLLSTCLLNALIVSPGLQSFSSNVSIACLKNLSFGSILQIPVSVAVIVGQVFLLS